ncbi:MAG: hypothetical protein ACRDNS_11975, partial [Trebonia sp.]
MTLAAWLRRTAERRPAHGDAASRRDLTSPRARPERISAVAAGSAIWTGCLLAASCLPAELLGHGEGVRFTRQTVDGATITTILALAVWIELALAVGFAMLAARLGNAPRTSAERDQVRDAWGLQPRNRWWPALWVGTSLALVVAVYH